MTAVNEERVLRLIAEYAAYDVIGYSIKTGLRIWNDDRSFGFKFNPCRDSGDALRLAVRLGINVVVPNNRAFYTDDQLLAETRRMIVTEALNRAYQIFPDRIEFKELVDALNSQKVTK